MSETEALDFWIYTSLASFSAETSAPSIQNILEVSRSNNERLRATGRLIFTGLRFAQ